MGSLAELMARVVAGRSDRLRRGGECAGLDLDRGLLVALL